VRATIITIMVLELRVPEEPTLEDLGMESYVAEHGLRA